MSELKVVKGSVVIKSFVEEMSEKEFEEKYPTLKDKIKFAEDNEGEITPWKVGDGYSTVIDYNATINMESGGRFVEESSEECILLALSELCKYLNINFKDLYKRAYPGEKVPNEYDLKEWNDLCVLPERWDKGNVEKFLADLTDVNFHSLARELKQSPEIEKIFYE